MSFSRIQSTFSLGELDPRLDARADWEGYYKGAKKLTNMLVVPQGGVTRRFGTSFVATIDNVPSDDDIRTAIFEIGENNTKYDIVFIPLKIQIYNEAGLITTVVSPYDAGEIKDLRWAQDAKTLTIVHPAHAPQILYYDTLIPPDWSLKPITFKNMPVFDFLEDYTTINFTFGLVGGGTPGISSYGKSVTVTASSGAFTTDHVGGIIVVSSMMIRITAYTSTTIVVGRIIVPPTQDTASGNGSDMFIAEPVWSDDEEKGWPASVSFFQNRLVFGGTKGLPEIFTMSRIGNFTDFNEWDNTPTAAITSFIRDRSSSRNLKSSKRGLFNAITDRHSSYQSKHFHESAK